MIAKTTLESENYQLTPQRKMSMEEKTDFRIIYLLTDFSDHARNACKFAMQAFGTGVNYLLINSFEVRSGAATLIDIEEIAREESLQALESEKKWIDGLFPAENYKVELFSRSGSAVDVINKLMTHSPADLIVVGSKGISKLDDFLIGSVTTSIIRGVNTPVLAVPLKAVYTNMEQLVLASDLNNANRPEVFEMVSKLKKRFNSNVSAATVKMDSAELSTQEMSLLKDLENASPLDEISILRGDNISKELMDYCAFTSADLLIVVAKHTTFFKRFFHKSITRELVNHDSMPILILEDN